ncbi:hypothetical protein L2E82_39202 [Cichorium intybus]|uniref:Uncharacterized protein n=1 Tax=Cichorium intybus TaxID=13427 RepID=A0ACB9AIG7_CICIN|nr:hypothetical protein L2E82_39202 [Cichorium intybus]
MTRKQKIPRDGTSVDEKESGQQMSLLLRVLCHGIGSPTTVIDLSTVVLIIFERTAAGDDDDNVTVAEFCSESYWIEQISAALVVLAEKELEPLSFGYHCSKDGTPTLDGGGEVLLLEVMMLGGVDGSEVADEVGGQERVGVMVEDRVGVTDGGLVAANEMLIVNL